MSGGHDGSGAPSRDAKGRWTKGHSGNSKGARPKKRRLDVPNQIGRDVLEVSRQLVTVPGPNGPRTTTKGELFVESVYANAIKGRPSAQKLWFEFWRMGLMDLMERHPGVELAEVFRQMHEDPTAEPDPGLMAAVDEWRRRIKRL